MQGWELKRTARRMQPRHGARTADEVEAAPLQHVPGQLLQLGADVGEGEVGACEVLHAWQGWG